jgi:hypothetical protein
MSNAFQFGLIKKGNSTTRDDNKVIDRGQFQSQSQSESGPDRTAGEERDGHSEIGGRMYMTKLREEYRVRKAPPSVLQVVRFPSRFINASTSIYAEPKLRPNEMQTPRHKPIPPSTFHVRDIGALLRLSHESARPLDIHLATCAYPQRMKNEQERETDKVKNPSPS